MKLHASLLIEFTRNICRAAGAGEKETAQVADALVEANLQGHDSHGIGMLPTYIRNIKKGVLDPNAHVRQLSDTREILLLDGQTGFGQVVGPEAMALAIAQASSHGCCIMGLKNAHHLGRIGAFAEQATAAGLISIHYVNVVGHRPLVAPYGGAEARFNTNPFCCGIPLPDAKQPLILDMATSTIALGKVRVAHNQGVPVVDGCLIDSKGRPTRDPAVMFGKPPGALTYIGGHKGYGLALICELLAGALVGQWTAGKEQQGSMTVINHMLTMVIDPAVFGDREGFVGATREFIDYIKATRPAEGSDGVLIPGEPERRCRSERLKHGIPMDAGTWGELIATAASVGIDQSAWAARGPT